jgi:hypothetical protein
MCDLCRLIFGLVVDLFRSQAAPEGEVLVLKRQIIVLRRGKPNRIPFLAVDHDLPPPPPLSTSVQHIVLDFEANGCKLS